jgi:outer membrane receptor for ferrienterochelin and colicin
MKKLIIGGILAATVGVASAVEVGVGAVYDGKSEQYGTRVSVSGPSFGIVTPKASATYITNSYTRFAVGADVNLVQVASVKLGATASGVYQNSHNDVDGYGVTAGLKATYDITKNIALTGGVERFYGQDRIKAYNGTTTSLSVSYKF